MAMRARASFKHSLSWRLALLPVVALLAVAALELSLGLGPASRPAARLFPTILPPAAGVVAPEESTPAAPVSAAPKQKRPPPPARFRAPAGVAVSGSILYVSDVPTNALWSQDLR